MRSRSVLGSTLQKILLPKLIFSNDGEHYCDSFPCWNMNALESLQRSNGGRHRRNQILHVKLHYLISIVLNHTQLLPWILNKSFLFQWCWRILPFLCSEHRLRHLSIPLWESPKRSGASYYTRKCYSSDHAQKRREASREDPHRAYSEQSACSYRRKDSVCESVQEEGRVPSHSLLPSLLRFPGLLSCFPFLFLSLTWFSSRGKVIGSRPAGLYSPKRTSAMASDDDVRFR